MKFAKELEHELVPEWRAKYLDYKVGKKKVKAIARAIQKANRTPNHPSLRQRPLPDQGENSATPASASQRSASFRRAEKRFEAGDTDHLAVKSPSLTSRSTPGQRHERQPLRVPGSRFSAVVGSYGSIVASPPQQGGTSDVASLELPDPALDYEEDVRWPERNLDGQNAPKTPSPVISRQVSNRSALRDNPHRNSSTKQPVTSGDAKNKNAVAGTSARRNSRLIKRVLSSSESPEKLAQNDQRTEFERKQDEFFAFLDGELAKIESFYQMKEREATERLRVIREQLHTMRDQRTQEVRHVRRYRDRDAEHPSSEPSSTLSSRRLKDAFAGRRIGKNSKALAALATPAGAQPQDPEVIIRRRDFARQPEEEQLPKSEVPYRSAKRKLKYALQEFYRGVELLKSYAYLNRTAFRKINKKYDKVVDTRPSMRYMSERVNKAWFVQSEVTESLLATAEDLYARYFEGGKRKIAASKLRHTIRKSGDYSPNTFRCGLLSMAGLLFAIQGLIYASQRLEDEDSTLGVHTSYLLQIYGGYFLVVFHFLLFCVDCMVWNKTKINYVFVFEYDTRHALDWRQLTELPCFFLFILGLIMWLNFLSVNNMYVYWPVVLIGLTVIVLFLPARILYHRSRKWWAYSNWRLLLAGLYPVEFRDFFLGDMYCSQTYAMGNIALFFCLYAKHWGEPAQCNSSHSRLLGFFTTLPSIWRAFQCIRRYVDTKNVFPHLLNFGKYMFGVLYYATLSMYRIDKVTRFQAPFITFALLNAVYCSVWDLAMDWSLGNVYAKHPLLRETLAFRRVWVYYLAMALDVIIRFNWIFYAIFAHDIQHSAVLSFVVSFSEICRRGMWTIFRVENEHCTNVILFRASRDVPLPYALSTPDGPADQPPPPEPLHAQDPHTSLPISPPTLGIVVPPDVEHGTPSTPGASLRPRTLSRVGTMLASAHAQDFQRKKRPGEMSGATVAHGAPESPEDTSDEEDSGDTRPYKDEDAIEEEVPSDDTQ